MEHNIEHRKTRNIIEDNKQDGNMNSQESKESNNNSRFRKNESMSFKLYNTTVNALNDLNNEINLRYHIVKQFFYSLIKPEPSRLF